MVPANKSGHLLGWVVKWSTGGYLSEHSATQCFVCTAR